MGSLPYNVGPSSDVNVGFQTPMKTIVLIGIINHIVT